MVTPSVPLLRTPPFPSSRPLAFAGPLRSARGETEFGQAVEALTASRVGGTYWGRRPQTPRRPYVVLSVRDDQSRSRILAGISRDHRVVCLTAIPHDMRRVGDHRVEWVAASCDPWHLIDGADEVFGEADEELVLIAALAGKRVNAVSQTSHHVVGEGQEALRDFVRDHPAMAFDYCDPFTGNPISLLEAINLCAFWKSLIDSNRPLTAAIGFAPWKRSTVGPLLWNGSDDVRFVPVPKNVRPGDQVAIWKSRLSRRTLTELQRSQAHLVEVEDGFIRSVGLGAECVPPLSLVVDRLGAYFDPSEPSELEELIEGGNFEDSLLERARQLRLLVVKEGVSKYASGHGRVERGPEGRRHLLVVGQVEDDRSVQCGGGAVLTNLELLRRVRSLVPNAFITYKPHPDVEAGHRIGRILPRIALSLADRVVRDQSIGALIEVADEVHVITSLAGFEALLRGRLVVTHGAPFYAGWGLTRDLGPIPARRKARRSLDELVAAVLLAYPRYLDPVSGLPCPPEILIGRLTSKALAHHDGLLVKLRRLQGRFNRLLQAVSMGLRG